MKTYVPADPPPPEVTRVEKPAEAKEYVEHAASNVYVPAPAPPTLIEILPAEYQTTNPPLIYRLASVDEPKPPDGRIAVSRTYRAHAFSCGVFYKPVSRVLSEWKEQL